MVTLFWPRIWFFPKFILEWPKEGDQKGGHEPKEQGQWQSDASEVYKAIATGRINHGIGLVADGGDKACRSG